MIPLSKIYTAFCHCTTYTFRKPEPVRIGMPLFPDPYIPAIDFAEISNMTLESKSLL